MGMWIIALSAAPVRQTVRGSLGGVPQGSAIGLLEKAPPVQDTYGLGAPEVTRSLVLGQKRPGGVDPCMGTQPRGFSEEAEDPTLNANLETPETTHVIELLFLL
ncbi:hypothetical protein JOQ06_019507 [Pogonophryne albipinna]|uniref:Uncharacterized protein n=1 Tax=Pogonophryne albipinna TaxID=1090488 RepID=A0AAD6ACC4_9TELE|nr:hypothetical protein JOQ06_019507 [Pogonophryne albipinna]